jgi:uncharacterized membrane protein YidH (DUF202 family)
MFAKLKPIFPFFDKTKFFLNLFTTLGVIILLSAFITLIVIIYSYWHTTSIIKSSKDLTSDSINLTISIGSIISGTVGVLFSLCSVIFFILALVYQQKELKQQRIEVKESRKVLQLQVFESTFFNLLKVQQDIRERVYLIERVGSIPNLFNNPNKIEYWDFSKLYTLFKDSSDLDLETIRDSYHFSKSSLTFSDYLNEEYHFSEADLKNHPRLAAYKCFFYNYQHILGHYFRNLYHTLKYVYQEENKKSFEEMNDETHLIIELTINGKKVEDDEIYIDYKKYADFIQAQMSTYELALLFYNGLMFPKMAKLLIYYGFLENLPEHVLIAPEDKKLYKTRKA